MLNIFPIQFLAPIAYALLRICVGFIFIRLGQSHLRNREELAQVFTLPIFPYGLFSVWCIGIMEIIAGILFILGLFTQIAALFGIAYSLKLFIFRKRFTHSLIPKGYFLGLLLITSISLFITGAGILAFDLPI